ncbi:hypothetical protein XU06_29485 (plasmid) [Rhodococcus erythropolis]|uniref:nuclear transport factor 2 family protein n=1 Tax=Rhodococcus erythropolis TaxID=1833 RepID=UPI00061B6862|nr:nuclear transport factor 2 family protein [Rhodococcus erythropolis]AKE01109.1 hypothetical protein XU06_29485 [Rhodococcus erythropolis]
MTIGKLYTKEDLFEEFGVDPRPDAELTREEIIARNLKVVEAHFHSENPDEVEKAVAAYAPDISWEAPSRGVILKDRDEILAAYRKIFQTFSYQKTIAIRRFATEDFVFDDQVVWARCVGDPAGMPGMPYELGTDTCVRLVHCFHMRDGQIVREIAYEIWRKADSDIAHDDIPEGSVVEMFDFVG